MAGQAIRSGLRVFASCVAGALFSASAGAEEGRLYYPSAETHLIRSKFVAQTFKIQVASPEQKRGEATTFPVIYATDGNRAFEMLKGISQIIQASNWDAPRFILVGIGYPSDSPRGGAVLRARDLTFRGFPRIDPKPSAVEGMLVAEEGTRKSHGGEDFQKFIERELVPFIDKTYRTVPGDRGFFGHSGGGGFGLFTLFTKPELFKRYIISSPGMLYHGELLGIHYDNYDFLFQDARRFIASGKSLNDVKLYMSVGENEEFEPEVEVWKMTSSFYRMAALLRSAAIPGIELEAEVFPRETHMTVWPMAFVHGVQAVFDAGAWRKEEAALAAKD